MKYTPRKILTAVGNRTGLTKLICNIFGLQKAPNKKYQIKTDKVFAIFNDSYGNQIELLSGLRDRIKPLWRMMKNPVQTLKVPSSDSMTLAMQDQKRALSRIENFLQTFSLSFTDKEILEIGAYHGSATYAFASFGAKRV